MPIGWLVRSMKSCGAGKEGVIMTKRADGAVTDREVPLGLPLLQILSQPFLNELSRMTPARKAAPMFHMAKAATMSIT